MDRKMTRGENAHFSIAQVATLWLIGHQRSGLEAVSKMQRDAARRQLGPQGNAPYQAN